MVEAFTENLISGVSDWPRCLEDDAPEKQLWQLRSRPHSLRRVLYLLYLLVSVAGCQEHDPQDAPQLGLFLSGYRDVSNLISSLGRSWSWKRQTELPFN